MVNREAVEQVAADLEGGEQLTIAHLGAVFGEDVYFMVIEMLLDSQDAARAIQNAMLRLSGRQAEKES